MNVTELTAAVITLRGSVAPLRRALLMAGEIAFARDSALPLNQNGSNTYSSNQHQCHCAGRASSQQSSNVIVLA